MGFDPHLARTVPESTVRFEGHAEHVHDEPHLIHVVMGKGVLTVPGGRRVLEPRSSVWMDGRVPHALELSEHTIALGPILELSVRPPEPLVMLGVMPAITDLMLARLAAEPYTPEQRAVFTRALGRILLDLDEDPFAVPEPTHAVARTIGREAQQHGETTLQYLCARHQVSTRHVQRLFLEQTGVSFRTWRTRRALGVAARSLREGASRAAAARVGGFSSASALLRALSRHTGTPEVELRRDPLAFASHTGDVRRVGA